MNERADQAGATAELARFACALEAEQLPDGAREQLKSCVLDFVGVAAGGRVHADSTPALLEGVTAGGLSQGPATVIGEPHGFSWQDAALLNGAMAHSLDFDDTYIEGLIHPGAAVIPAALASAERLDCDGRSLVAALAAGYEVCCRLGLALGGGAYARGFHPTAVAGVFGAVAAGARLYEMSVEQTASAFGLAGSMACGSMQYLDNGGHNKRLHPGLAARNALLALDLARCGLLGAAHALEGRSGFLHAYTETPEPAALTDALGSRWLLAQVAIKPYPACRLAHGAIDAALNVRGQLPGSDLAAGAALSLQISPRANEIVGGEAPNKRSPQNAVDAQFSVYFLIAVALLDGAVTHSSYARIADADVCELMQRIELRVNETVPLAGARLRYRADDDLQEAYVERPRGEPDGGPTWEATERKYYPLAEELLESSACRGIARWVERLPDAGPVRELTGLLRAGAGAAVA